LGGVFRSNIVVDPYPAFLPFQMHKEDCEKAISEIDGVDGVNIELGVRTGRHFTYDG
jgi:hypothetical protein